MHDPRALANPTPSGSLLDHSRSRRPRVIVAEDDSAMRLLLVSALTADGCDVGEAASGHRLFDELRRVRGTVLAPDLIVSDIRMPGQTGTEVLRSIRSWGWHVPVILITAFGGEETQLEAARSGSTWTMDKPFEIDDLRLAVSLLLHPRATRENLRDVSRAAAPKAR